VIAQVPAASEVALAVTEEKCGRVVAPGDVVALAAAVVEMQAAAEETRRMGERARAAYVAKYTLGCAAETFLRGWPGFAATSE
jgi:glycosyltransferase involved in cell wall biosynthesis